MTVEIYRLIGELLAAIGIALFGAIVPKIRLWLNEKADAETLTMILAIVKKFVSAAEQLYTKETDSTGELRKEYVKQQLEALGYEYTQDIDAIIEGAVYELNQQNK